MERLHAEVYGWVQGVSFRYNASRRAHDLGLTGWVRNREDGSVETLAEGDRPALEAYLDFLQTGPLGARVREVIHRWQTAPQEFHTFSIRT